MRVIRSLIIGLLAAFAVLAFAVPSQADTLATGRYVALGDSYSSGLGSGGTYSGGSCKRSTNAYPQLWANSHAPSSFAFAACSGAVTQDVLSTQISSVTSSTALVTISIGGNDAGFADVMTTCNTSSDETCVQRNNEAQNFARTTLPPRLDNVYNAIRSRAPSATVVVVGYPRIYQLSGSCWVGLSETKRAAINQSADVLAQVTAARAGAHGFRFLDARSAFAGHEICASGTRWINSVSWPVENSYHPNAAGQNGGYHTALRNITG